MVVSDIASMASVMDVANQRAISLISADFAYQCPSDYCDSTAYKCNGRIIDDAINYGYILPSNFPVTYPTDGSTGMQSQLENGEQASCAEELQRLLLLRLHGLQEQESTQGKSAGTDYVTTSFYSGAPVGIVSDRSASNTILAIAGWMRNSKYLDPAKHLLDEVVCVRDAVEASPIDVPNGNMKVGTNMHTVCKENPSEQLRLLHGRHGLYINGYPSKEKHTMQERVAKLLRLLEELEYRYKKYCHQMDVVISSLEAVAGGGAAKSYITLTIHAMSRHFSNLRFSMMSQLQAVSARSHVLPPDQSRRPRNGNDSQLRLNGSSVPQNMGRIPLRQIWRPLRGLPESSVLILRKWLFEHFLHPYPNDTEKHLLSLKTGLTRNQISNWFINARVRLWKPMIEEMYMEEFRDHVDDSNPTL